MAQLIPDIEPGRIVAGDTVQWTKRIPDYLPADGWSILYVFIAASGSYLVNGSDNGDGRYLVTISPATSALLTAAEYSWQAKVTKAGEVHTVDSGVVSVVPDLSNKPQGYDPRSDWQVILDNLEAAYKTLSAGAVSFVTVTYRGRQTTYRTLEELVVAINKARQEVRKEQAAEALANGDGLANKIYVRF